MRAFAGALFVCGLLLELQACAATGLSGAETADDHNKESAKDHGRLITTLSAADIAAPQLVARILQSMTLLPGELGQLDSTEWAELGSAMKAAEVTLGDRFRVRRMSVDTRTFEQVHSDSIIPTSSYENTGALKSAPRGLQSGGSGGVSGDSIALIVTALLGSHDETFESAGEAAGGICDKIR